MTSQQNNDTNTTPEPNWMKEECVQSIPKEKLHFLQKLVFESSSLSQKELLPFLMALAQRIYEASISFPTQRFLPSSRQSANMQHQRNS